MASTPSSHLRAPVDLIAQKLSDWYAGFFEMLPNVLAGLVFLLAAWLLGRIGAALVRRLAIRRGRPDLGQLLGSLFFGAMMIAAIMVAAAIVFPSVQPGDILAALGISSVAIGFAFKDILQNLFAGVLLLIRRPFRRDDQIVVKDYEGTVEHIESRATMIRTYDGRQVIIPNADIYTSPVVVNTAYAQRRGELDIGIGYGDRPDETAALFLAALKQVEGVLAEPVPDVLPWELAESAIVLKLRWWCDSRRASVVHVRSRVVATIRKTAADHGIDLPFPTQVLLFHDQTEETDGDRAHQREGWPALGEPPRPRPIGGRGRK